MIEAVASASFWSAMADHLSQSGIVILVLWALARAIHRAPARYHTAIWWFAIGKLLLPVSLLGAALAWLEPSVAMGQPLSRLGQAVASMPGFGVIVTAPRPQQPGAVFVLLSAVWILGALALPVVSGARARRRAASIGATMPRVVGVLRPRVVVPDALREAYARALARTVRLGLVPALGSAYLAGSRQSVVQRIDRIRNPERFLAMRRHNLIRVAAFGLLAVSLVPALAGALAQQMSREDLIERIGLDHAALLDLRGVGQRVDLLAEEEPLRRVLRRLGRRGGFEVVIEGRAGDRKIGLGLRNVTIGEALVTLARDHSLEYLVTDGGARLTAAAPVRIGGEIQAPGRVRYVAPEYPQEAREMGLEGIVIMETTIDTEGRVVDVQVLRGLHPLLDEAAVASAMQWLYTPVMLDGEPVESLTVTVQFQLQHEG